MSSEIQSQHQHQHYHDKQRQRELLQQKQKTFPFILYNLLEYATGGPRAGDNCDTISSSPLSSIRWLPDGNSFIIQNKDVLMRDIMPRFFPQQTKYRSFTRQLNIWGFLRTAPSSEIAAEVGVGVGWRHKDFVRGKPHLLQEIDRVANKSQSADEKQHQSAKDKVNAVFAATAAAGGTSPAPYSRASRSSLGFQFLSSHMVVNNNFCSVTRSCADSTEPEQMELEMEGVNVNIANTEGSIATTDAKRSRRSDDDAEVSQLQDNDSVDEVGEFNIMELDKIFDKDGDDKLSKAWEDDLLSILSLDEDRHTNLFVCEEEDNLSSDFDMVYNTSTRLTALAFCGLTSPSGGGF